MIDVDSLTNDIDRIKIQYPEREIGFGIEGRPFGIEFDSPINMREFVDDVFDGGEPYNIWGIQTPISEDPETGDKYWKVLGVAYTIDEDGEICDSSKASFEFTSEWMRVYVKEGASSRRIAEFVSLLSEDYEFELTGFDKSD